MSANYFAECPIHGRWVFHTVKSLQNFEQTHLGCAVRLKQAMNRRPVGQPPVPPKSRMRWMGR